MAAVAIVRARPCTPVGYEYVDKGTLTEAVTAGALLTQGSAGWSLADEAVNAHGIALMDGYAGQKGFDIGIIGEMDGFSGLTPGDPLYPSQSVEGGIDTTAPEAYNAATTPEVSVPAAPNIRARSATRIYYNFV